MSVKGIKFARLILPWLLFTGSAQALELLGVSADVSGNVGYAYRSLNGTDNDDAVSNQFRGTLTGNSYIMAPWIATTQANVTFTRDATESSDNGTKNTNSVITGNIDLNVLPRSRTPFLMSYHMSDSRVDLLGVDSPLTNAGGQEFKSQRLSLKQSYLSEEGHRFQGSFDTNDWESSTGETYDESTFGLELDWRVPKQSLTAKTSFQEIDRSQSDTRSNNLIVNVDHFYYPNRDLRVDSSANILALDTASTPPSDNLSAGQRKTDLLQLSSFLFWRPIGRPLSLSGGLRYYDLGGSAGAGTSSELTSLHSTLGLLYQFNKNLRVDGNVSVSTQDDGSEQVQSNKERLGGLYQSDIVSLFSAYTYQWHGSGSIDHNDTGDETRDELGVRLGHDVQRLWVISDFSTMRINLSQTLGDSELTGEIESSTQNIDHSASFSWERHTTGSTTTLRVSLQDARRYSTVDSEQQFVNIQMLRHQPINRRSALSGNLTVQYIRQGFDGQAAEDSSTTTGQISYNHSHVFGVPRLRFWTDLRISNVSSALGIDRTEWENRLDYSVGLLDVGLSWRQIETDIESFNLLYIQATRNF